MEDGVLSFELVIAQKDFMAMSLEVCLSVGDPLEPAPQYCGDYRCGRPETHLTEQSQIFI